jgi:hypothetical protein
MEPIQYEYSALPNNWEAEMLSWDLTYRESLLGNGSQLSDLQHDTLVISLNHTVETMMIEQSFEETMMPEDVYNVYLTRHLEGRGLPCQQSI